MIETAQGRTIITLGTDTLVSKSVILNDLERRNGIYFALFHRIRQLSGRAHCAKVVEDVVVGLKSSRSLFRSPDEFLV